MWGRWSGRILQGAGWRRGCPGAGGGGGARGGAAAGFGGGAGGGGGGGGGAGGGGGGGGAVPSLPERAALYDLNDMLTEAALPTWGLITVQVHEDGRASLALPRAEVGQGVTTSSAMLVGEELDLPLERVRVTLADA